jgi:hypothetical protein
MADPIKDISEVLDEVMTLDIPCRGLIKGIYKAARKLSDDPLVLSAARRLKECVTRDDPIFIATGYNAPGWNVGEGDGPVGAAVLARALKIGFGASPTIITDSFNVNMVRSACFAVGLNVPGRRWASIEGFPIEKEEARRVAEQFIEERSPRAVIAIERPGFNEKGVYHTGYGMDINNLNAKLDYLFEEASSKKIPTIGIGDGGNEIGMGNIHDYLKQNMPYGSKCQCPCGAGIATATKTDILVAAAVSNWGAYGISACLSALLENPDVFHNKEIEMRALREVADAGAPGSFGGWGNWTPSVDNLPDHIHASIVEIMRITMHSKLTVKYVSSNP